MRFLPTAVLLASLPCLAGPNWTCNSRKTLERTSFHSYLNWGQEPTVDEIKDDPFSTHRLHYVSTYEVGPDGGHVEMTLHYAKPYASPEQTFEAFSLKAPAFRGARPAFQENLYEAFFGLFPPAYAKEVAPILQKVLATQEEGAAWTETFNLSFHLMVAVEITTSKVWIYVRP